MDSWKARPHGRVGRASRVMLIGVVAAALIGLPTSAAAAPSCAAWAQGTHAKFGTLQAALDASPAGATILVRGTCVGATVVSRNVTIRPALRRSSYRATLDGGLAGSVIKVMSGVTLRIERLIITRGVFQSPDNGGGGIVNEGTLVMDQSRVTGNTGQQGGGIANLGDATILNSRIDHNGTYQGGNIFNDGTLTVMDSELDHGGGRFGQGLWNESGATATLVRTSVTDSDPALPFSGAGIENYGNLTLDHSDVSRNVSLWGGGILNQGTARLISSTVSDNDSASGGGGILNGPAFFAGSGSETLILIDSTISANTASTGGGVYNKGIVTMDAATRIGGNTAGAVGQGGGIFNDVGASVVGVTSGTFTPANVPDDCVGCGP